jgi:toxin ParE1/3/4
VPAFSVSSEAENDLDEITEFTIAEWGLHQAEVYLRRLEEGFQLLTEHPSIGRSADFLRSGLRRFEIGRHVVFYTMSQRNVLKVRVLHESMMPSNYL